MLTGQRTATEDDEDGTAKNAFNQEESSWYFKYFFAKLKKNQTENITAFKVSSYHNLNRAFLSSVKTSLAW